MRKSTHKQSLLRTIGVLLSLAVLGIASAATPQNTDKPNIILVMADDMGFSDPGCYGGEIKTPTIDRLAAEGIRFSQFYNCNVCGPSRASLMTGCYPWQVGVHTWSDMLNQRGATIPQLLQAGRYETCMVGRFDNVTTANWHKPDGAAECFDYSLGTPTGGAGNFFKEVKGCPWFHNGKRWKRPVGAYSTDLITDFVVEYLESRGTPKRKEKPFFLYVSQYAPHWPLQAKEEDVAEYERFYRGQDRVALMQARLDRQIQMGLIPAGTRLPAFSLNAKPPANDGCPEETRMALHAAMVESIDRSLARILEALEKSGERDNTLILVLSDNGASAQEDARRIPAGARPGSMDTFVYTGAALASLSNTPFVQYKLSDWQGGIAAPLIAWWPKGIQNKGCITDRLTHISDIMPTCLELAGVSYPSEFKGRKLLPLDGKSFVLTLRSQETDGKDSRTLVWPKALREGDWKLVLETPGQPRLFNLGKDRNELKDLAAEEPERVRAMLKTHAKLYEKAE